MNDTFRVGLCWLSLLCTLLFIAACDKLFKKNPNSNISHSEIESISYPVVDTVQSNCFDNSNVISCPGPEEHFYGQDGHFVGNIPSYWNKGNGIIVDNTTGLLWSEQLSEEQLDWPQANDYCKNLHIADVDTWRLPSVKEVWSIHDYSATAPWLDVAYFGGREEQFNDQYTIWTDNGLLTENVSDQTAVKFSTVKPEKSAKDGMLKSIVRCVSGNSYATNNFFKNSDGTVKDLATGLIWFVKSDSHAMNWKEALHYAQNATFAGFNDWRLPNLRELQSILDTSIEPNVSGLLFNKNIKKQGNQHSNSYYWTSTSYFPLHQRTSTRIADKAWYGGIEIDAKQAESTIPEIVIGYTQKTAANYSKDFVPKQDIFVLLVRGGSLTLKSDDRKRQNLAIGDRKASVPPTEFDRHREHFPQTHNVPRQKFDRPELGRPLPNIRKAAETLGVSERELMSAMRTPNHTRPNFDEVAKKLGVTREALESALHDTPN